MGSRGEYLADVVVDKLVHGVTELRVPFFDEFLHRRRCERWRESEGIPANVV